MYPHWQFTGKGWGWHIDTWYQCSHAIASPLLVCQLTCSNVNCLNILDLIIFLHNYFCQHNIFPQTLAFVLAPFYEFSKFILWNVLLFFKLSILPLYSDSNELDQPTWRNIYTIFHLFMPFFTCVWSPLDHTLLTDRWVSLLWMDYPPIRNNTHCLASPVLGQKFYYPRSVVVSSPDSLLLFSFGGDQDLAIVMKQAHR